jgi:hypothetical protein
MCNQKCNSKKDRQYNGLRERERKNKKIKTTQRTKDSATRKKTLLKFA